MFEAKVIFHHHLSLHILSERKSKYYNSDEEVQTHKYIESDNVLFFISQSSIDQNAVTSVHELVHHLTVQTSQERKKKTITVKPV